MSAPASARAMAPARPIPEDAPVTTATFPSSFICPPPAMRLAPRVKPSLLLFLPRISRGLPANLVGYASDPFSVCDWRRTLAVSRAQWPQRRRSGATVLIVKGALSIFLVLYLLRLPGCPMFQHSIENGQQLMHTRGQSDFFDFPRGEEPLVKNFDLRVVARGHEGPHV